MSIGVYSIPVKPRQALAEIKRAVAKGRYVIGIGDMVFANVSAFEVEEAVAAATSCVAQGDEWVIIGPSGDRFVIALEGDEAAIVGYQR